VVTVVSRNRSFVVDADGGCVTASRYVNSRNHSAEVAHNPVIGAESRISPTTSLSRLMSEATVPTIAKGDLDVSLAERSRRQAQRANPRTYEVLCKHNLQLLNHFDCVGLARHAVARTGG
jgi:hypothetical protein